MYSLLGNNTPGFMKYLSFTFNTILIFFGVTKASILELQLLFQVFYVEETDKLFSEDNEKERYECKL